MQWDWQGKLWARKGKGTLQGKAWAETQLACVYLNGDHRELRLLEWLCEVKRQAEGLACHLRALGLIVHEMRLGLGERWSGGGNEALQAEIWFSLHFRWIIMGTMENGSEAVGAVSLESWSLPSEPRVPPPTPCCLPGLSWKQIPWEGPRSSR